MIPEKIKILRVVEHSGCKTQDLLKLPIYKSTGNDDVDLIKNSELIAQYLSELNEEGYIITPTGKFDPKQNYWINISSKGRETIYQFEMLKQAEERASKSEFRGFISLVISALTLLATLITIFFSPFHTSCQCMTPTFSGEGMAICRRTNLAGDQPLSNQCSAAIPTRQTPDNFQDSGR